MNTTMNEELLSKLQKTIEKAILAYHKDKSKTIFDQLIQFCQEHYEGPAHTIGEIKQKQNTKIKGDVFEHFVYLFLLHAYKVKFDNVWLLKDVPPETLKKLKLKRSDMGIDLIAEKNGNYWAVQAKYRKRKAKARHGLTWNQLSTFFALAARTGPYLRYVVVTNTDFVPHKHLGGKGEKDVSICYRTLAKIKIEKWMAMAGLEGQTLEDDQPMEELDVETLREKRLKYFEGK